MNESQIRAMQDFQYKLSGVIYSAMRRESSRYGMLLARYTQTVMELREASGLGEACPAYICDCDLYQFYSDMHKSAYGVRYRGSMTPEQMEASIGHLSEIMERESDFEAEQDAYYAELEKQMREEEEAQYALECAYDTRYDHLDPQLQRRAA